MTESEITLTDPGMYYPRIQAGMLITIGDQTMVVTEPVKLGSRSIKIRKATWKDRLRWEAKRLKWKVTRPVGAWWSDLSYWGPLVLKQRCTWDENWSLGFRRAWWMTAKAFLALLLGREGDIDSMNRVEVAVGPVMRTHSMEFGEGGEFDYLGVSYKGWHYEIGSDGWP